MLEGPKLLAEALDAGIDVEQVVFGPGADRALLERARGVGVEVLEAEPGVIERVADAVTPQPLLSVARFVDVPLARLQGSSFVVVCVELRDPGNLGTVLRGARSAGADGVVCTANTVDLHGPKVVRAAAGSMFHIPVVVGGKPVDVLATLGEWGLRRQGAVASGGADPASVDLTRPTAIVVGNESHGFADDVAGTVDGLVTIPMAPGAESLNVAMATTILCFETARQRREAARA